MLSIQHLARRSPTSSRAALLSLIAEKEDIATKRIQEFEQTFSGARAYRKLTRGISTARQLQTYRADSPTDEGIGSSLSPSTEKGLASTFDRILDLFDKDSGLGSSIHPSEDDGLVKDLIQGWLARCLLMVLTQTDSNPADTDVTATLAAPRPQSQGNPGNKATSTSKPSAVTQSIAPHLRTSRQPRLSRPARQHIADYIIDPILREEKFKSFHPLVTSLGAKNNKTVRCLRDIEQSLIFQPLVSRLLQILSSMQDTHDLQTLAVSGHLFRLFGEFSIQLVVDTYHHLSEHEQRRASDRPYSNGYFLDLVQQVGQLAAHIGRSRTHNQEQENADEDAVYSPDDEVTIEGGLADTGTMAELVRWKDGQGTSLRTGLPYEPKPAIKREHTSEDLDEDVARSMARRKKGVEPEIIEMPCSHPDCDKVFTRKCDLSKHEKTHSRPFKCTHKGCKYVEQGLPTEKELERHMHDKHDPNPKFYACEFCEFKTKRESNCKQHMEKKHGWTYHKTKGAGRSKHDTPTATPKTPSMGYSPSEPSPASSHQWDDVTSVAGSTYTSVNVTPYEQPAMAFPGDQVAQSTTFPLFPTPTPQPDFSYPTQLYGSMQPPTVTPYRRYGSASNDTTATVHALHTPVTPTYSIISNEEQPMQDLMITMDYQNGYNNTNPSGLHTPNSYANPHSRQSSMHESPSYARTHAQAFQTDPTLFNTAVDPNAYFSQSQLPAQGDFDFTHDFSLSNFTNNAPLPANHSLFEMNNDQYGVMEDEGMGGMEDFIDFQN